jgi:hypothetical protein
MTHQGSQPSRDHAEAPIFTARWHLQDSCQLQLMEFYSWFCVEVVNWETGDVLVHADIMKDTGPDQR